MNIRDKLMRKARKSKVREEYKLKRNEVNIMIRKAKSDYTRTLLSENESVAEVKQLLKKIKLKKAAGNYDLPPGLLKGSAAVISAPLTHIINLSFLSDVFPSDSKIVKILPLYKMVRPINLEITA